MNKLLTQKEFLLTHMKNSLENIPYFCGKMSAVNSNPRYMVPKHKEQYISPECEVLEIRPEGIIAASGEVPDMTPGWEWNF